MAGDWIKMREALHEDPAVLAMANGLATRPEHVVGYCHRFWSWVSRNCHDGIVTGVTIESLESVLNLPGFLSLMRAVGWLEYDQSGASPTIAIPKFDRHLSQGAKSRGLNAERQRAARNGNVTSLSRTKRDEINTREEKRREEINTPPKPPSRRKQASACVRDNPPSVDEVKAYAQERGGLVDAQEFHDHYTANGWVQGDRGKPLVDWKAAVRKWEHGERKRKPQQASRLPTPEEISTWTP